MLLSLARDADAFTSQNGCSFCKAQHSSTATVNTSGEQEVHQHKRITDRFRPDSGSFVTLYLFPTSTAVSRSCWSCSDSTVCFPATNDQSFLATSNTPLQNFSTAHGLLSPDVVFRLADSKEIEMNGPLDTFLKTYLSRGPMSCLYMLSDPEILPDLTKAMRAVV